MMRLRIDFCESEPRARGAIALRTIAVRCLLIALVFAGVVGVSTSAWAKSQGSQKGESWHATTFVRGSHGMRVITYWSKNDWMRAETLIVGHPIVTIVRGKDYIAYDRLTSKGVRVRRPDVAMAQDGRSPRPFGNDLAELVAEGGELVESERFGGQEAEVWRVTDRLGRRKLWVTTEEPKLPMRLETFVRVGAETITTDYSGWARGMEIPDEFFSPPREIQLDSLDYTKFLTNPPASARGIVLYPDLLHGPVKR